ncbi:hypothetical protein PG993_013784 [Apiospora rasikravindrae]|uniref:Uncharacterized protein n=1 Tax=Apiospora rasikravindrae TaxID=990691 RepID=A0ABR1RR65_9PEZI
MMQSLMGGIPSHAPQFYAANTVADEYTRQLMMAESARRSSRASNGYRPTNAMRVTKPGSASTSPQSMMARRRTLVNDNNIAKRRQYALEQMQMAEPTYESYQEPPKRSSRPVSWHPSTQFQQPQMVMYQQYPPQQLDYSQYFMPTPTQYTEADIYAAYQQLPPTPAIYSRHTSPVAALSPVSLPYTTTAQEQVPPQYVTAADTWATPTHFNTAQYGSTYGSSYESSGSPDATEPFPSYTGQSTFTWDTSSSAGYNAATTPPTPETFQPVSQPEPVVPVEEPSLYQAAEESEEEGEILIGMGLYDTPDKSDMDPQLDHYRTTTSNLLGSTYRKGAGLKLEEAWEPPKEEEDDEEDAESEEEE